MRIGKLISCLGILVSALALGLPEVRAAELEIANSSEYAILNILVEPDRQATQPFFIRLDLFPGAQDTVENPGIRAALRVDAGLQLWNFAPIDLRELAAIDFCGDHPVCMKERFVNGEIIHIRGVAQDLLPQKGIMPVCHLDKFRPAMPMKEVCAILSDSSQVDDNGAVLASLGFAKMIWAARLAPEQGGRASDEALLEHLELRMPISRESIDELLSELYRQGFVPWQAEFPGIELEFDNNQSLLNDKAILESRIREFLERHEDDSKKKHSKTEKCEQASILMAPSSILPALRNSDEPLQDVEMFTIYLRPCIKTLLLDVAAYRAQGIPQADEKNSEK